MRQLSRYKALKAIHDTGGRIFAATFIKKDGSTRHMVARIGVTKNQKGGSNGASAKRHPGHSVRHGKRWLSHDQPQNTAYAQSGR